MRPAHLLRAAAPRAARRFRPQFQNQNNWGWQFHNGGGGGGGGDRNGFAGGNSLFEKLFLEFLQEMAEDQFKEHTGLKASMTGLPTGGGFIYTFGKTLFNWLTDDEAAQVKQELASGGISPQAVDDLIAGKDPVGPDLMKFVGLINGFKPLGMGGETKGQGSFSDTYSSALMSRKVSEE